MDEKYIKVLAKLPFTRGGGSCLERSPDNSFPYLKPLGKFLTQHFPTQGWPIPGVSSNPSMDTVVACVSCFDLPGVLRKKSSKGCMGWGEGREYVWQH